VTIRKPSPATGPKRRRRSRRRPLRRWAGAIAAATVATVLVGVVIGKVTSSRHRAFASVCRVTTTPTTYTLDADQATNATTIAAVGKRLGLPNHAVTVALAAALQESRLHNLTHGDRDSVGLFQQRPSQGWGTPAQLLTPRLAAAAFFDRLAITTGWQSISVNDAAQRVQRSAAPDAYAQWEPEARAVARAATGEVPAGLACHLRVPSAGGGSLAQSAAQELGPSQAVGSPVSAAQGWTMATWLVGHAQQLRITSVVFAGQRWTPSAAIWVPYSPADDRVQVTRPLASTQG
jgi:hypothetical protein